MFWLIMLCDKRCHYRYSLNNLYFPFIISADSRSIDENIKNIYVQNRMNIVSFVEERVTLLVLY